MTRREDGFSLVETLVAFAILTGSVIAGFQIFADGVGRLGRAADRTVALEAARGELAELARPRPGDNVVEAARGRKFRIVVTALPTGPGPPPPVRPFRVRIWSAADAGGTPLLDTILVGPAAP